MKQLVAILAIILCAGCAPVDPPAPSASYGIDEVRLDAGAWVTRKPGRVWTHVAATGSMLPLLDERCIALYEQYVGQVLSNGDVIYVERSAGLAPTLHAITAQNTDSVRTSGLNVRSDGWVKKSAIRYRLAGVLYSERK